ncbi:VapB protein of antitoxin of type II toxin-antitoxin system [Hasllibacter halocynthiae]|uniref:VapB protein of antitoxin of type II toxin-antitoxin system n=2 Tax=Hasllibacter halocynthiae TaxID=595589 RepID=A0A2T0WZG3_9RHOB|nr:VapB protein of antitoxin of type II toxin-antitoxin system [Hasllibacter halocynthiae]
MRTTVTLDEGLLDRAEALTGLRPRGPLLNEALRALVERESARRLARLGGSDSGAEAPGRRRSEAPPR